MHSTGSTQNFRLVRILIDLLGANAKQVADLEAVLFAPLVANHQLRHWEAYTQNHSDWTQQGLAYGGIPNISSGPVPQVHPSISIQNTSSQDDAK